MRWLTLLLLLTTPCFARLGESEQELIKRFGQPTFKQPATTATSKGSSYTIGSHFTFKDGDWQITCVLVDDRCARISYSKRIAWETDQHTAFLNANAQGAKWTADPKNPRRHWTRSDGGAATLSALTLTIVHPAYDRAVKVAEAKASAKSKALPKKL